MLIPQKKFDNSVTGQERNGFRCIIHRISLEKNWELDENTKNCMDSTHSVKPNILEKSLQLEKQSQTADLRQRHVVRQVAAPYSVWPRFPLCPTESNGNENFKVMQNPGFLLDHLQNWITCSFCHSKHSLKISERYFHNFLSYLANTQTDRQTDKQTLANT